MSSGSIAIVPVLIAIAYDGSSSEMAVKSGQENVMRDVYSAMAVGMAIGTGIGSLIGAALDNAPFGIGVGIAVGAAAGYAYAVRKRK